MRILELFAGYGSQALALKYLGIDFISDISEIDQYAIKTYNQIHGETHNWGDICKIDEIKLPYYDLITYSSPCQDFSIAGLQKGGDKGSCTRSSLLWECERIIKAVKPKYLLMENVKNLVGKAHMHNFVAWLKVLEDMGYTNYWQVLNAKDYGVPQNRERVFVVSILGGGEYFFPKKNKLEKRLKDVLEPQVDEKYYLSDKLIQGFLHCQVQRDNYVIVPEATKQGYAKAYEGDSINLEQPNSQTRRGRVGHQIANTLTCSCNQGVIEPMAVDEQNGYIRKDGCVGTLTTDGSSPKHNNRVIEPKVMQVGNIVHTGNFKNPQRGRIYSSDGCSPALNTCKGGGLEPKITEQYRIRKLTPRECWRLMGVKDEDFDKITGISNSQLYKMAGNSIVVDVLMGIFKNIFIPVEEDKKGQMRLI